MVKMHYLLKHLSSCYVRQHSIFYQRIFANMKVTNGLGEILHALPALPALSDLHPNILTTQDAQMKIMKFLSRIQLTIRCEARKSITNVKHGIPFMLTFLLPMSYASLITLYPAL